MLPIKSPIEGSNVSVYFAITSLSALNICKYIAAMAATADGKVDAILLTGGIAHSKSLMDAIKNKIGFIAPVEVFPGEDEINSLAENGYMILSGEVKVHTYDKDKLIED